MSDFASVLEKNRELSSRVALIESELARNPGDYALEKDLRSITRLAQRYDEEFRELAKLSQIDVCKYRIDPKDDKYSVKNVAESLLRFQDVITSIYDSKVSGPKTRARYGRDIREISALQFGYTFAGSLGVVLTLPSERDMFSGRFDDVVDTFQQILDVGDEHDVRDISKRLGMAVIGQVYQWAANNSASAYSLDIRWTRSDGAERGEYVGSNKLQTITDIIGVTKDLEDTQIEISGILVGINVKTLAGSFHLVTPGGPTYTGRLADGFDRTKHWKVNTRYTAKIRERKVTHFATEQTDTNYFLEELGTELFA